MALISLLTGTNSALCLHCSLRRRPVELERVRDARRAGLVRRGSGCSSEEGGLHPCIPSTDLSSAFFVLGTAPSTGNAAMNKADKNPSPCGVCSLIATKQARKTIE